MHYQNKEVFHNISLNIQIISVNGMHLLNLILTVPHILELPNTENVSLSKGYARLFFCYSNIQVPDICHYSYVLH